MELVKKLRLNTERVLYLLNAPTDRLHYFDGFDLKQKFGKEKPVAQLILFVYDSAELSDYIHRVDGYISHDTLFWICYPKKTGAISSDLVLMKSWDVVSDSGYRGQTSVSVDEDWSALRVTNAPRSKPSDCDVPMEERKAEGIDYVNRTVKLPADAEAALDRHAGLGEYFYSLSFTHKKEHMTAINDAKKLETRQRRIEKMVEMLQQKMKPRT